MSEWETDFPIAFSTRCLNLSCHGRPRLQQNTGRKSSGWRNPFPTSPSVTQQMVTQCTQPERGYGSRIHQVLGTCRQWMDPTDIWRRRQDCTLHTSLEQNFHLFCSICIKHSVTESPSTEASRPLSQKLLTQSDKVAQMN